MSFDLDVEDGWGGTYVLDEFNRVYISDLPQKPYLNSVAYKLFYVYWDVRVPNYLTIHEEEAKEFGVTSNGNRKSDQYWLNQITQCTASIADMVRFRKEAGETAFSLVKPHQYREIYDLVNQHLKNWERVLRSREVPHCPMDDLRELAQFEEWLVGRVNGEKQAADLAEYQKVVSQSEHQFEQLARLINVRRPTRDDTPVLNHPFAEGAGSMDSVGFGETDSEVSIVESEGFNAWRSKPVQASGIISAIETLSEHRRKAKLKR